jgi:hypothetical protein
MAVTSTAAPLPRVSLSLTSPLRTSPELMLLTPTDTTLLLNAVTDHAPTGPGPMLLLLVARPTAARMFLAVLAAPKYNAVSSLIDSS